MCDRLLLLVPPAAVLSASPLAWAITNLVGTTEWLCPKLQRKSGVPDSSGGSLHCPGLCPGWMGKSRVEKAGVRM